MAAELAPPVAALLAPYLEVVDALNERGRLKIYPGSPALARAWLRPQDRLIACEIEPKAAAALRQNLRGDIRIKTLEIDGWTALGAYVPPKERRGLVLVDPPFEAGRRFRPPGARARRRAPQMGDRHLRALVSDQRPQRARRARQEPAPAGHREDIARRN